MTTSATGPVRRRPRRDEGEETMNIWTWSRRAAAAVLGAGLCAFGLAACGDSKSDEPKTASVAAGGGDGGGGATNIVAEANTQLAKDYAGTRSPAELGSEGGTRQVDLGDLLRPGHA